jgi:hypothetical protein
VRLSSSHIEISIQVPLLHCHPVQKRLRGCCLKTWDGFPLISRPARLIRALRIFLYWDLTMLPGHSGLVTDLRLPSTQRMSSASSCRPSNAPEHGSSEPLLVKYRFNPVLFWACSELYNASSCAWGHPGASSNSW